MKKNLHEIDKLFKDALDGHLEAAPPGVWDAVNNDLDKKQALHFRQKYFRLKRVALILLLFAFSGIAYTLFIVKPSQQNKKIAEKTSPAQLENNIDTAANATAKNSGEEKTAVVKNSNALKTGPATREADSKSAEATNNAGAKNKEAAEANTTSTQNLPGETSASNIKTNAASVKIQTNTIVNNKNAGNQQKIKTGNAVLLAAASSKSKTKNGLTDKVYNDLIVEEDNANSNAEEKNNIAKTDKPVQRTVTPLAPYLYSLALLPGAPAYETPASVTTIESSSFLNAIQQNQLLQNTFPKNKPAFKPSFSIMPFASINHSFTRLENDEVLAGPGRNKKTAERDEKQGGSFSAGILVNYNFSRSFILQSGIVYTSATTNILPKIIYARPDNFGRTRYEFNCSSGYSYIDPKTGTNPAVGDSIQVAGSSSTLSYIGIPLSLNYVMQKGKFLFKPAVGFSVNFLTSGKSFTSFNNASPGNPKETASISGLKTAYVDGSIGFGTEYMLSRKISIGIRPNLRMALSSINKNTPIKTYQNFLSLEAGLKINL